ncbi:MAG TPA: hypothetical protein VFZ10_09330 [Geminicoccaceae bacterium]
MRWAGETRTGTHLFFAEVIALVSTGIGTVALALWPTSSRRRMPAW